MNFDTAPTPNRATGKRASGQLPIVLLALCLVMFCLPNGPVAAQPTADTLDPDQAELTIVLDTRPSRQAKAPVIELAPLWPSSGENDPRTESETSQLTLVDTGDTAGDVPDDGVFVGKARLSKAEFALVRVWIDGETSAPVTAVKRVPLPSESRLVLQIQSPTADGQVFEFKVLPAGSAMVPRPRTGGGAASQGPKTNSGEPAGPASGASDGSPDPSAGPTWIWGPWAWGWTLLFLYLALAAARRARLSQPKEAPQFSPWLAPTIDRSRPLTLYETFELLPGTHHIHCEQVDEHLIAAVLAVDIAGRQGWPTRLEGPDPTLLATHSRARTCTLKDAHMPNLPGILAGRLAITPLNISTGEAPVTDVVVSAIQAAATRPGTPPLFSILVTSEAKKANALYVSLTPSGDVVLGDGQKHVTIIAEADA